MARRKQSADTSEESVVIPLRPEAEGPVDAASTVDEAVEPKPDVQSEPAPVDEQPEQQRRGRGPGLNRAELIGRLTADPKVQVKEDGLHIVHFDLATNGGDDAEFHHIVAFGKYAEFIAEYLTKGRLIFVEGRLQTRPWIDRNGQPQRTTSIVVNRPVQVLSSGRTAEQ